MILEERIGTAIHLNTIPPEYRKYPVIGRGTTSIVLEKDPNTVIILTRDAQKKDWLTYGITGLDVDWKGTIDVRHPVRRELGEMPVYVLEMPKLLPLDAAAKRRVKEEIRFYDNIRWSIPGRDDTKRMEESIQKYLEERPDGLFAPVFEHLGNYHGSQFVVDLHMGNFMMDINHEIVVIDPVIDRELLDIIHDINKNRSIMKSQKW